MKKLLAFGVLLLLTSLSIVMASPLPLLLRAPQVYTTLKLSDVDISKITAYAAENQLPLISSLINGLDIAQDVMVYPGVKNKIPMPKLKVGKGWRPYSGTEDFKLKNLKYTDRYLEVKVGKRELQIDPEDYMLTYLAQANSAGSSAGKKEIPFGEYMWNQVILELQSEINDETAYKGFDNTIATEYDPLLAYTTSSVPVKFASSIDNPKGIKDYWLCIINAAPGQTPDNNPTKWQNVTARAVAPGIESHILDGIALSEIAPITTGAITAATGSAIAAHTRLFRSWTPAYRRNGIITSASYTDYDLLMDDILVVYTKYTKSDLEALPYLVLPNSNRQCIVKPASWLGTSRRLISGPSVKGDAVGRHQNLFMGTDLISDATSISIKDTDLWTLKAGIKARIGFNYQDSEAIKVTDQP